jgi:hypothetical protein
MCQGEKSGIGSPKGAFLKGKKKTSVCLTKVFKNKGQRGKGTKKGENNGAEEGSGGAEAGNYKGAV